MVSVSYRKYNGNIISLPELNCKVKINMNSMNNARENLFELQESLSSLLTLIDPAS